MSQEASTREELSRQIAALQQQLQVLQAAAGETTVHTEAEGESVITQGQDNVTAAHDSVAVGRDVGGSIVTGNNNSVTHIRHIYRQAPNRPALDEEGFNAALGRYLAWVERRYGRLDLRGVEKREQKALSLTLDDIYVSLAAVVSPKRKGLQQNANMPAEERLEAVDMSRLLPLSPRLVITGGPGCGKSTYLHLIAATLARAIRLNEPQPARDHLGLAAPLPLPIVISLSEYNHYRRQSPHAAEPRRGTLTAFISHHLIRQQAGIGLPDDFFERLLVNGRVCLLLLDGLDEVANERERLLVSRAVEELAYNDGVRQMVVTSRIRAYQGQASLPEEFRLAAVQPMTPEQTAALVARWCAAVYPADEAAAESSRLQEAIAGLEQLRAARGEPGLVNTPLMATIVAIVHYNQRRLPDQRAELYEKCVEVLLAESNKPASEATFELADWGGSLPEKRGYLAYLAYEMMSAGQEVGRNVSERQLTTWLRPRLARKYSETQVDEQLALFTQAMRERGSLLDERGGAYRFTHLTFQEFLCAYYLAETVRDPARIVDFWADNGRLADSWWRETILLTVGYLGLKSIETALELVNLLADLPRQDKSALAAAELGATAFLELESQDEGIKMAVTSRLVALLTTTSLTAAPAIRLLGGDALARLGDPRPGVCSLEPEMIPIAAGPFLMGDKPYTVTIRQSFAIGRYPVTNAQYRFFVEDGGYTEKWRRCWTKEGWSYREKQGWREPRLWGEADWSQANQPVVRVSWYEAVAYARWLAIKTGKPYRLPTEAEWERAARHTDGRTYPWGEGWQDGATNTETAGLKRTTAVGVFPQDRGVCGAQDMGGNVNEWCQTRWRNEDGRNYSHPYHGDDGREELAGDVWRVWRGGAYNDEKNWSRCDARHWYDPRPVLRNYGFRLALSPFESGF
jgi:formylglycine-generating enzyme required for sulfatase activity